MRCNPSAHFLPVAFPWPPQGDRDALDHDEWDGVDGATHNEGLDPDDFDHNGDTWDGRSVAHTHASAATAKTGVTARTTLTARTTATAVTARTARSHAASARSAAVSMPHGGRPAPHHQAPKRQHLQGEEGIVSTDTSAAHLGPTPSHAASRATAHKSSVALSAVGGPRPGAAPGRASPTVGTKRAANGLATADNAAL